MNLLAGSIIVAANISAKGLPQTTANSDSLRTILSIVFAIIGALALLMLVLSGLRYIVSAGDPQRTAKAKDGIVYAFVGLAIALAAQAIIAFVVDRL